MFKSVLGTEGGHQLFCEFSSWISKQWGGGLTFDSSESKTVIFNLLTKEQVDEPFMPDVTLSRNLKGSWVLEWRGTFTSQRRVRLLIQDDDSWVLSAETGTENPSTFFGQANFMLKHLPEVCALNWAS